MKREKTLIGTEMPIVPKKIGGVVNLGGLLIVVLAGAFQALPTSAEKPEPGSSLAAGAAQSAMAKMKVRNARVLADFAAEQGPLLRTEQFNTWDNGDPAPHLRADDADFLNEIGLRSKMVRVGFSLDTLCNLETDSCDFGSIASWLDDISRTTESLVVHLTPKAVIHERKPALDALPLLKLAITELKNRFPKIDYIEATNEPDWEYHGAQIYRRKKPILEPRDVYPYYIPFYQAVAYVNETLALQRPIQIGGPALTGMNETWLTAFLDGYAADSNPDKRLDFISYHGYGQFSDSFKEYTPNKPDPSVLSTQRDRLNLWLSERDLPQDIPVFITETGIYPGPSYDEPDPSKNDYLRQAAGMASQHYWWAKQTAMYPFNWVVRHETQGRKDQLITHTEEGPLRRTLSPYGNMLVMQAKMKNNKVDAVSDSLEDGRGVYALASKDQSGIAVMLWNYQHVKQEGFDTHLELVSIPTDLQQGEVRKRVYRIDSQTSNYWADPAMADLTLVSESREYFDDTFDLSFMLTPNSLYLLLLEPL